MKSLRDIPPLPGAGLDGHASQFRKERGDLLVRLHRECGDIGRIRFFNLHIVSLGAPALLHEALVERARSFEKSLALRMIFHRLAGKGLFTSEGELWRRQRKLMSPLFNPAAVRGYADVMNATIARHLDAWQDGAVVDIGREMTRITMAVAGKTLFDADRFDDADELGAAVRVVFAHLNDQGASLSLVARAFLGARLQALGALPPWADAIRTDALERLSTPTRWPTPKSRRLHAAFALLDAKVQQMIQERRQGGADRRDLLSALLAARDEEGGGAMTDRQVRDEAVTLFVAGHETTATGTTWALTFLAQHPEVYRRWKAEVAALGGRAPTADLTPALPYTAGIFKEALRLYPPAFLLDRVAIEDVAIGGYLLPKGSVIIFSPYALHRQPKIWPDPDRFDPDRFTPEAEAARPKLSWMPFGAGPRVCIGAQFAILEAQILLAQIAQRFELEALSTSPVRAAFERALRPAEPVRVRVRRVGASPRQAAA
jgi:cytochrome P450